MRKKNKYKLSKDDSEAAREIVAEIAVRYSMTDDKITSTIAVRRDVESDELLLRIGQQVQKCMTTVMPSFKEHMDLVDRLARMGADIGVIDDEEHCTCENK